MKNDPLSRWLALFHDDVISLRDVLAVRLFKPDRESIYWEVHIILKGSPEALVYEFDNDIEARKAHFEIAKKWQQHINGNPS